MENGRVGLGSTKLEKVASVAAECETCIKRERYQVFKVKEGESVPNPARLMMNASPLCVLITETRIAGHAFLFHRCLDPMCLLNHVREGLHLYWFQERQRNFLADIQQEVDKSVCIPKGRVTKKKVPKKKNQKKRDRKRRKKR